MFSYRSGSYGGGAQAHPQGVAPSSRGSRRLGRGVSDWGVDYRFVRDVVAPELARGRWIFGDLARCGTLVGESVPLYVVSPLCILFVRKEGLGDVELASLAEPRHPVSCVRASSSEASESHSPSIERINW
jgi:hypothetical protein